MSRQTTPVMTSDSTYGAKKMQAQDAAARGTGG